MAEYVILLLDDEAAWAVAPPEEYDRMLQAHNRFQQEALGGCYLIEAADRDQAPAIAKPVPVLSPSGGVEVRPVMVF